MLTTGTIESRGTVLFSLALFAVAGVATSVCGCSDDSSPSGDAGTDAKRDAPRDTTTAPDTEQPDVAVVPDVPVTVDSGPDYLIVDAKTGDLANPSCTPSPDSCSSTQHCGLICEGGGLYYGCTNGAGGTKQIGETCTQAGQCAKGMFCLGTCIKYCSNAEPCPSGKQCVDMLRGLGSSGACANQVLGVSYCQ